MLMQEMTWPEFEAAVARGATVFVPCGSTEQHGPHLPLGVDVYLSTALAKLVAAEVGGLVAPAMAYGYKSFPRSGGGAFFPGTLNADGATVVALTRDIVRELHRHGVRRIVFFVGHFENQWFVTEGIDLAVRELRDPSLKVMRFEYWDFISHETLAQVFPGGDFTTMALEHAAVLETSLMLHFYPELVRVPLIPDHPPAQHPPLDVWPPVKGFVTATGALAPAAGSTAEKGRIMAEQYTRDIAAAVRRWLA